MSYVVDIPRLPNTSALIPGEEGKFNPAVKGLDDSTLTLEFRIALETFFVAIKRLFPECDTNSVYDAMFERINKEREEQHLHEFSYYEKYGTYVLNEALYKLGAQVRSCKSRLATITQGGIFALFDGNSERSLAMLVYPPKNESLSSVPFFRSKMLVGRQVKTLRENFSHMNGPFHIAMVTLCLGSIMLHQIETALARLLASKLQRDGAAADYPTVDFARLQDSVSFWRPGVVNYLSDINYKNRDIMQESIYLRTLLSTIQVPLASLDENVVLTIKKKEHVFRREQFTAHSIYIDDKLVFGKGSYGVVVGGCPIADRCKVLLKVALFTHGETNNQKAASKLGFGPPLLYRAFSVYNEATYGAEYQPQQEYVVFTFDKLDKTLHQAVNQNDVSEEDVDDILNLLLDFEEENFIHHDLKTDNIMVKIDQHGRRRWYLIDFGTSWYGGDKYGTPGKPEIGVRIPYGFNFTQMRVLFGSPNPDYKGWTPLQFYAPPKRFDLATLMVSLCVHHAQTPETRAIVKLFAKYFMPYLKQLLVVHKRRDDDTVFYREDYNAAMRRLNNRIDAESMALFHADGEDEEDDDDTEDDSAVSPLGTSENEEDFHNDELLYSSDEDENEVLDDAPVVPPVEGEDEFHEFERKENFKNIEPEAPPSI